MTESVPTRAPKPSRSPIAASCRDGYPLTSNSAYPVKAHTPLAAQTTRQNGSINYPVKAVRLYISTWVAGFADLLILQGGPK